MGVAPPAAETSPETLLSSKEDEEIEAKQKILMTYEEYLAWAGE